MHAIHRTAPMPCPRVGVRVAGEPAAPSVPSRSFRSLEPSESLKPSEPLEPFDWAVEEPDWADGASGWADGTGPAATAPDWWLRDRPILATPPMTTRSTDSEAALEPTTAAESAGHVTGARAASARRAAGHVAGEVAAAVGWTGDVAWRSAGDRGVRLTRRGRLVVVGLAVALLLGAFWIGTRAVSAASTTAGTEVAYVQNGDTLWAVAERARPGVDPRDTVARIRDLNGLKTTLVQPGQRLVLPAR